MKTFLVILTTINVLASAGGSGGGGTFVEAGKLAPGDYLFDSIKNEWVIKTETRVLSFSSLENIDKYNYFKLMFSENATSLHLKDIKKIINPFEKQDFIIDLETKDDFDI